QLTSPSAFDLADNMLVVHNTAAYSTIAAWVQSGRNGGSWDGSGIVTSQAVAPSVTTLGVMQTTASTVEVMYTYGGDANLDGHLDVDDYGKIDFNVNLGNSGWVNGDFN